MSLGVLVVMQRVGAREENTEHHSCSGKGLLMEYFLIN